MAAARQRTIVRAIRLRVCPSTKQSLLSFGGVEICAIAIVATFVVRFCRRRFVCYRYSSKNFFRLFLESSVIDLRNIVLNRLVVIFSRLF